MKYKPNFLHNHPEMEKILSDLYRTKSGKDINEPHNHVIVDRQDWEQFKDDLRKGKI